MSKVLEWVAYGDADPLAHGGTWVRQDEDFSTSFKIVVLTVSGESGEERYYVNDGFVDLTDSWIDWHSVIDSELVLGSVESNMTNAVDAVRYYGLIEFGGDYGREELGVDAAIAELKLYGIEV